MCGGKVEQLSCHGPKLANDGLYLDLGLHVCMSVGNTDGVNITCNIASVFETRHLVKHNLFCFNLGISYY